MNLTESFLVALRALAANKLRSALTMLGIIIGVAAVITLMSVGQGVQRAITEQIQGIGSNLLFVVPGGTSRSGGAPTRSGLTLTMGDYRALADRFNVPDAVHVAPELDGVAQVVIGNRNVRTSISGVTPDYASVRNSKLEMGRFIAPGDLHAQSRVAVLGQLTYERLFPDGGYPIGQVVRIKRIPFKIVGVLAPRGGSGTSNEDDVILVPLTVAYSRLFNRRSSSGEPLVTLIYVQVASEDRLDDAAEDIIRVLRERHRITYNQDDDFTVISQKDLLSVFGQITGLLTLFLGSIAGISLLVGGIGIMNIMLVSVTERTREIGIRKAVGANRRDILLQFLIEAIVLSLIGGVIGIALGFAGSLLISQASDQLTTYVSPGSVLLAAGFSTLVGVFFGLYPAVRASRLNPIDALRYE